MSIKSLCPKPLLEHANCRGPACAADGGGQRDFLGTDGHAILGVAALLNATFGHQRVSPLSSIVFAGRIEVEQYHLANSVSTNEATVVRLILPSVKSFPALAIHPFQLDLEILRASIETAAAAHAFAERVHGLLRFLRDARTWTLIVVAVGRNPGFDFGQCAEQPCAIDDQVADDGKLTHGGELDLAGVLGQEPIDQS